MELYHRYVCIGTTVFIDFDAICGLRHPLRFWNLSPMDGRGAEYVIIQMEP
jgi:hypothetical protein